VPCLATILITLLLAVPAMSIELFRYRGAAKDGGTLEYVFEASEQNSPNAITREKAAEIAADFYDDFLPRTSRRTGDSGISHIAGPVWLVCFSDTVKGSLRQMFFVVLLPDRMVVEPRVEKRL
jgi:hypothetical protein